MRQRRRPTGHIRRGVAAVRRAGGAGERGRAKEPSARARMVTERLRREDEGATRRRRVASPQAQGRRGRADGLANRAGVAGLEGRGRRKRRLKAAGGDRARGHPGADRHAAGAADRPRSRGRPSRVGGRSRRGRCRRSPPAERARRRASTPSRPTLKEPFRGSPALQWADGAAGIEIPAGRGRRRASTRSEVADGARQGEGSSWWRPTWTRRYLRGERPDAALDPPRPEGRGAIAERLRTASRAADRGNGPAGALQPVRPGGAADPWGTVVKVRGRMWLEPGPAARTGRHQAGLHLRLPPREG